MLFISKVGVRSVLHSAAVSAVHNFFSTPISAKTAYHEAKYKDPSCCNSASFDAGAFWSSVVFRLGRGGGVIDGSLAV